MENKIIVKYSEKEIESFQPDTPSFDKLKDFIIENKDCFDANLLSCECDKEGFDIDTFTKTLKESIQNELEFLKINKQKYEEALKNI